MPTVPLHREPIASLMTCVPHAIPPEADLADARAVMEGARIHHLPVVRGSELLGVVSAHDIEVIEVAERRAAATRPRQIAAKGAGMTVAEALTGPPTTAFAHESIGEVVTRMARDASDACVVLRDGLIAGVVTHTDLLRAFLRLLGAEADFERPEAIRAQILREHQRIRGLLDHMDDLASRLAHGELGVAPRLRKWTREFGAVFRGHLALEERILVPAIREADAFGDARAAELLEEHEGQRALLDRVIEDLHTHATDAVLAVGVAELVRAIREDMVEEERDFLGDDVLCDTVVSLDAFGG